MKIQTLPVMLGPVMQPFTQLYKLFVYFELYPVVWVGLKVFHGHKDGGIVSVVHQSVIEHFFARDVWRYFHALGSLCEL